MRIVVDVQHHFSDDGGEALDRRVRMMKEEIMSVVSDKIAEVKASFDAAVARLQAEAVTQADLDALDALKSQADSIAPEPAPAPTPEPAPEPAPAP